MNDRESFSSIDGDSTDEGRPEQARSELHRDAIDVSDFAKYAVREELQSGTVKWRFVTGLISRLAAADVGAG